MPLKNQQISWKETQHLRFSSLFGTSYLHGILVPQNLPILVALNSSFCISSIVRPQKALFISPILGPIQLAIWQMPERKKLCRVSDTCQCISLLFRVLVPQVLVVLVVHDAFKQLGFIFYSEGRLV